MVAGYASFIVDPHLNLAKVLIASFGTINTNIILFQIYCLYGDNKRQNMANEDNYISMSSSAQGKADPYGDYTPTITSVNGERLMKPSIR